jgi:endonuclease/exonuclease/phosphatase family metal-dependent hydrolase
MIRAAAPTLLALMSGCLITTDGTPAPPDATWPAYDDPAYAQVGTFNIDWLWDHHEGEYEPRNAVDYAMVARIFTDFDLDLVALQEINGAAALELLELPPDYAYVVGESGWSQNPAILYRSDRIEVVRAREVTLPGTEWPSKDLLVAEVSSLDGQLAFTFVVVHLNPFGDEENAAYRHNQVQQLYTYVTGELPATVDPPFGDHVIVAGDFNDTFEGIHPGYDTLQVFEDDEDWVFATEDTDEYTELWYRSKIDHVLLTSNLASHYLAAGSDDACQVIAHDQLSPYNDYEGGYGGRQNISSHRPVWIYVEVDAGGD